MNILTRVKLSNKYDLVVNSLYNDIDGVQKPITDIEGTRALLTTDGTSWELVDGAWLQIESDVDAVIKENAYTFIMSVCDSIHNNFTKAGKYFTDVLLSKNDNDNNIVISDLSSRPDLKVDDFLILACDTNAYLSKVVAITDNTLTIDNTGLDIRITGDKENVCLVLVTFPPQFLGTVLDMLGYDMFIRESKEKRQEKLGNYTYTNFEPTLYYGDISSFPKRFTDVIKYWQNVFI